MCRCQVFVRELYKRLPDGPIDWAVRSLEAPRASLLSLDNVLTVLASLFVVFLALNTSRM